MSNSTGITKPPLQLISCDQLQAVEQPEASSIIPPSPSSTAETDASNGQSATALDENGAVISQPTPTSADTAVESVTQPTPTPSSSSSLTAANVGDVVSSRDPTVFSSLLLSAVSQGQTDVVTELLDNGCDVNLRDQNHNTLLMLACEGGHIGIAKMLVERGADIDAINWWGKDCLMTAGIYSHAEIVSWLIEIGCEIDRRDYNGDTLMLIACRCGFQEIAEILAVNGSDFHLTDRYDSDCLENAVHRNQAAIVSWLIEIGCEIYRRQYCCGSTLLSQACWHGYLDVVKVLVENGADIHRVDSRGDDCKAVAAKRGHREIVSWLNETGR